MTGTDGSVGPDTGPERQWDVALSYAGAQRDYVGQVAQALKARGVRCFYDADEQVRLWGTHLAEELPLIYAREAAAVVVFISADYTGRDWTRLERRAAFSRAVAEAGVYVLPARFDDSQLSGLLPDVVTVDLRNYTPEQFADLVVAKLADLAISQSPGRAGSGPASGVRVDEVDPRRLGVHAAISVPGVPDDVLPEYVPRDVDTAEHGVRAMVAAAARRGGFVLLVGGSSVGKTRCAVEAVKTLLPDWRLVHPAGPGKVAALASASSSRTVVWLDELQRYLDGEHGLTGGVTRALLNAPHPVVLIGTLWPDRYTAYITLPAPGDADPRAREREVLDLAAVIRIDPDFSPAEHDRARAAAAHDPRLQVALGAAGYGLTQTLAAAPQLVARWRDAQTASPYAWAVLTAALDTARLGARAPLSADLLCAAAPGYCTSQQRAEAPSNWFEQALAYATGKLHGAAAALSPAAVGMGQIAGYIVADYLVQHVSLKRRYARVPASTWDAILSHVRDPADAARLADSARARLLYRCAIPLYRHAADIGDTYAAARLANLLATRGDLDELRDRADAGDAEAADQLAGLLAERGDLEGLRDRADAGDKHAAGRLAGLLAERGDFEGAVQIFRSLADAGDKHAAGRLADLLSTRGDLEGLRARADAGDKYAPYRLAGLLAEREDLEGLRARADAGDKYAAGLLAGVLARLGDFEGAVQIFRSLADVGDKYAAALLAGLLGTRGDLEGLRDRADAGDEYAADRLAGLLGTRVDLEGLRARADLGDKYAAALLAGLLARLGDFEGAVQILRSLADAGDGYAADRLAGLLVERGDFEGAVQILRSLADAGDKYAADRLAGLLAERGDLEGLRARADAGDTKAAARLAGLLAERGDLDELRARANAGGKYADQLAGLLAERGDLDELRARANAGDEYAAAGLAEVLIKHGRGDEAERLRRFGLNLDGSIAYA